MTGFRLADSFRGILVKAKSQEPSFSSDSHLPLCGNKRRGKKHLNQAACMAYQFGALESVFDQH
jgi:hypothetical protein